MQASRLIYKYDFVKQLIRKIIMDPKIKILIGTLVIGVVLAGGWRIFSQKVPILPSEPELKISYLFS